MSINVHELKNPCLKFILLVSAVCTAFALQSAKADLFTFDLGIGNSAISPYSGPYAQVVVDRTSSSTATITFTSLTNSGFIYLMGDGGTAGVNVNGAFTLGNISGSNSGTGFTPGPYSNGGAGNLDGFGSFNLTINSFDGFTHSSDTVSFDLTGGNWADAASVLVANSSGFIAASHIFVTTFPADGSNGALATGFAGNGGTNNHVPDGGATAALLGVGLAGLGGLRARFGRH
jgi:hypothetical protein